MAGLVPAIHVFPALMSKSWRPGTRPGMTKRETLPVSSVQSELVGRRPGAPVVVRHRYVGRAQELEGVVHRVGKARHAADIRALADAFCPNGMMGGGRRGPVGLPFRGLDRGRQEVVHERGGGDVA